MSKPMVRGPQMAGGGMHGMNVNLDRLKIGGSGAPAITGPLLPSQAVFRQKPWLPWWVAIVIPLLALLALLLFLFLPKNVKVPDVVGKASAFDAEQVITEAKLRMAPQVKEKVDPKAKPGSIIEQTPPAGETAEEDSEVAILIAVGTGKVDGPERGRQDARRGGEGPARGRAHARRRGAGAGRSRGEDQEPDPRGEGGRQGGRAGRHLHGRAQGGGRRGRRRRPTAGGGGERRRRGRRSAAARAAR